MSCLQLLSRHCFCRCCAKGRSALASSAAASLVLVEYLVKGCSIGLETSFWQGWLVYLAINILLYLITGRVRISVCVGMAVAMVHGLIDHYVLLFRGTPVLLSDVYSIGTAANVAESYSAPVELSVLWVVGAAVLYCACVCLMKTSLSLTWCAARSPSRPALCPTM